MKRTLLTTCMAFILLVAYAQENSYIVKTRGAKHKAELQLAEAEEQKEETAADFIGQNFKFYSLCDWQDGMKFMVVPNEFDMVMKTFIDAETDKGVSSMKLRHKIMIYKGHETDIDGRDHINFLCQDDNRMYYYEIPSGSFDDYCFGKPGVPTLAYLGDVDIAREKLMNQTLVTRTTDYRVDVDYDSDSYNDVKVEKNMEVKVVAVGVGTRSFPVKIIVADKKGNEFYQNVAISKTNSGMRDDEFIVDNEKFTFYGSFDLMSGETKVSTDYAQYMGKTIYTKYATSMTTKGGGKDNRVVKVPKLMAFRIDGMAPVHNSNYVTLTLSETETGRVYSKDVTFVNESVVGDIDGQKEDYFGYLFGFGEGKLRNTNAATRTMIREGRVGMGMTEEEVEMAVGEPDSKADINDGRYEWTYKRTKSWLIIQFSKSGKVVGIRTPRRTTATKAKK